MDNQSFDSDVLMDTKSFSVLKAQAEPLLGHVKLAVSEKCEELRVLILKTPLRIVQRDTFAFTNKQRKVFFGTLALQYIDQAKDTQHTEKCFEFLQTVFMHELMHIVFNHVMISSQFGYDHHLYNIACDLVINHALEEHKYYFDPAITLCTFDNFIKGLELIGVKNPFTRPLSSYTSMEVYDILLQIKDQIPPELASELDMDIDTEYEYQEEENRQSSESESMTDEDKKLAEISNEAQRIQEQKEAERLSKTFGNSASGLLRSLAERLTVKKPIQWERLTKLLVPLGPLHMEYFPPHRRFLCGETEVYSGRWRPQQMLGSVVWITDTSGSISAQQLQEAMTYLRSISARASITVHCLFADAELYPELTLSPYTLQTDFNQVEEYIKGGGGTDFRPAVDKAIEISRRENVSLIVYYTDGYGSLPPAEILPQNFVWLVNHDAPIELPGRVIRVSQLQA